MEIKKNKLMNKFELWGPEFHLEFDIVVYKLNEGWTNVFHIGIGENNAYSDRIPSKCLLMSLSNRQ